ncbi:heme-binding protein [Acinetobacter sp. ANC 4779]|uniref:SOUL family heme-binding protein n=1 Tax=Acinetobacter sp. ANC 4779 TaxID=2529848 RepID=UPI00103B0405|nr:heme-binding protein [Acinetobacter sp. ANC 4779]TCB48156.1 heme-binding protein [Acinetobacter sp. ANC 4779]
MAVEEASYVVISQDKPFEIREYAPHVIAETLVEGNMENVSNKAFMKLFRYISGSNVSRSKVAMTAPVSQQSIGEKIPMTAPVAQQRVDEKWLVSFTMPKSSTLSTLPQPEDASITLRQVPAQRMAVVRYSGMWSEKNYLNHELELVAWMKKMGLTPTGNAVWARYNPPFTPWFLRRNEVMIPVHS